MQKKAAHRFFENLFLLNEKFLPASPPIYPSSPAHRTPPTFQNGEMNTGTLSLVLNELGLGLVHDWTWEHGTYE